MKHKLELDVFATVGIIFTIVGIPTTAVGIWLATHREWVEANGTGDTWLMAPLFLIMGLLVLVLGLSLVAAWRRKARSRNRALEKGVYVWGRVDGIQSDWSVRINGWPAVFVAVTAECDGAPKQFEGPRRSRRSAFPDVGTQVRVYIDHETGAYAITDSTGDILL